MTRRIQLDLMTVGEVAREAGLSESTVRNAHRTGALPGYRTRSGVRFFLRADALRFVEGRR
jgi:excisionase family DNA binding protein